MLRFRVGNKQQQQQYNVTTFELKLSFTAMMAPGCKQTRFKTARQEPTVHSNSGIRRSLGHGYVFKRL